MKKIIKKNWAVIGFALGFILDSQYGILEKIISEPFWLNIVKGLGVFVVAFFSDKKFGLVSSNIQSTDEADIGGGGYYHPPKP